MKIFILLFVIFFSNLSFSQSSNLISIDVKYKTFSDSANLTITNRDLFPHIVLVKIYNSNDSVLVSEFSSTVAGNSVEQFELKAIGNIKFGSSLRWVYYDAIGSVSKLTKDHNFLIPFPENYNVLVCQSPDGPQSSHYEDKINAIDFCAKEKTPIVAAKDGTVIKVIQTFTETGKNPGLLNKANVIEILHDDGLISSYSHIFTNSSDVNVGDKVKQGQQIALVGSVGYSSSPHLHFEVLEGSSKLNARNSLLTVIPIKFFNTENQEIKIEYFSTYNASGLVFQAKKTNEKQGSSQDNVIQSKLTAPQNSSSPNGKDSCGGVSFGDDKSKAIDCYAKRNYDKSIYFFTQHVKKFPNDSLSLARLAISFTRLDRHKEAINAYKNAIAKNWISYDFASLYARSLFAIGEKEEAVKWSRRAIVLAPNCIDCIRDLAMQLKDVTKKKEAYELIKNFDENQKSQGKTQYFQGLLMLFEDEK